MNSGDFSGQFSTNSIYIVKKKYSIAVISVKLLFFPKFYQYFDQVRRGPRVIFRGGLEILTHFSYISGWYLLN